VSEAELTQGIMQRMLQNAYTTNEGLTRQNGNLTNLLMAVLAQGASGEMVLRQETLDDIPGNIVAINVEAVEDGLKLMLVRGGSDEVD
jgi:hypothetical protein